MNRIADAARGSSMLLHAILRAKGIKCAPSVLQAPVFKPIIKRRRKMRGRPVGSVKDRRISATIIRIQEIVAAHFELTSNQLLAPNRKRAFARPRQIAVYLSRRMTPSSYPDISFHFGGLDHTTLIHAVNTIQALADAGDAGVINALNKVHSRLEE